MADAKVFNTFDLVTKDDLSDSDIMAVWNNSSLKNIILSELREYMGGGRGLFSGVISNIIPTQANTGLSTWVNQGTAIVADINSGINLQNLTTSSGLNGLIKTAPTAPYTITALLSITTFTTGSDSNYGGAGIGWRDSSTGKFQTLHHQINAYLNLYQTQIENWSNYSTIASIPVQARGFSPIIWMRLKDDGTTIYFQFCNDGYSWLTLYSIAKSSGYLGSSGYNQIVFYVSRSTVNIAATLIDYVEE